MLRILCAGILVAGCGAPAAQPTDGGADDAAPPMATGRCAGQTGPDCLLELSLVNDTSTLGLALDGPILMTNEGTVSLAEVPFRFQGVPWHGMTWTHRASLILPLPAPAGGWKTVAVYSEYIDPGTDVPAESIKEFAARQVAAGTGVPVVVLANVPPNPVTLDASAPEAVAVLNDHPELANCFGAPLEESPFQRCTDQLVTASRDLDWMMAPILARAYLRSLLALRNLNPVLHADATGATLAAFQPDTFGTGGYSKRGMAQWFVGAAGDPTLKAIWVGSGELPDVKTYTQLKYMEWGDQSSLIAPLSTYDTPFGMEYLAQTDPASWATRLGSVKISAIRGTDDEIWPFGLFSGYAALFPTLDHMGFIGDTAHVYTASGGLTLVTPELLAHWQGFVGSLAGKAPAPTVTATFDLTASPITVTASITGATNPVVRAWWVDKLHCTKPADTDYAHYVVWGKDDDDMRDVGWSSMTLTGSSGTFTGTLPMGVAALPLHGQVFVDVFDGNRFASTIPMAVTGGTEAKCP
jgi:hypothetical protein